MPRTPEQIETELDQWTEYRAAVETRLTELVARLDALPAGAAAESVAELRALVTGLQTELAEAKATIERLTLGSPSPSPPAEPPPDPPPPAKSRKAAGPKASHAAPSPSDRPIPANRDSRHNWL